MVRIVAPTAKTNTTLADTSTAFTAGGSVYRQYISAPIGVVNFTSTTWTSVIRGSASLATFGFYAFVIKLYHVGGTLTSLQSAVDCDTAFATTAGTEIVSAGTLLSVTSTSGDRLVIECGGDNASASSNTIAVRFGDNAASDFALTAGLTTDLNPWIEFTANIPFLGIAPESTFLNQAVMRAANW